MERAGRRRVCLFLLAALLAACSCTHPAAPSDNVTAEVGPGQIPVTIAAVGFDEFSRAHYVMLSSEDHEQELPILIGDGEAAAIDRALHGEKPQRPLTQDLMKSIIDQTGSRVDCISISDVRDEVYYATIFMNGGKSKVDSRPSDAIALAASTGAPIFVASKLFEEGKGSNLPAKAAPLTAKAMGITVQELTPSLAHYFRTTKGVLVADVSSAASKNGVERGDVIIQVGTHAIATPAEFSQMVQSESGPTVMLRVSHDGAEHNVPFAR